MKNATGRARSYNSDRQNNSQRTCWICGGTGHFKKDCPSNANRAGRRVHFASDKTGTTTTTTTNNSLNRKDKNRRDDSFFIHINNDNNTNNRNRNVTTSRNRDRNDSNNNTNDSDCVVGLFPFILDGLETALVEPNEECKVDIYIGINSETNKVKSILDTGASLSIVNHAYIKEKEGAVIKSVKNKFNVKTANGSLILNKYVTLKVIDQDYPDDPERTQFYHKFYIVENIPYDIIIGRPLMRMLRYRIIRLEKEYFRHKATPTGVLTERDNKFYEKLIDIPAIERVQHQKYLQQELDVLQHHIHFIQQYATYPNPLDIDKIRTKKTQNELAILPIDIPDEKQTEIYCGEQKVTCGYIENEKVREEFRNLWTEYGDIVSKGYTDIGKIEGVTLKLDLKEGAQPPTKKQIPRKWSKRTIEEWKKQRPLLEGANLISRSSSPYAHHLYYVPKKKLNGKIEWRPIINYIPLNKVTIKDKYPLPNINDIQRSLTGKKIFTTIDLRHAYHHIEIKPEDRYKTAFIAPDGLWEWNRMSFGFTNAPATFQRGLDVILADIPNVYVYLDDILIATVSEAEMLATINIVLYRIKEATIKLGLPKCEFFMRQLKYLGHIVSGEGSKPDPEYISKVINLREPTGVDEIRRMEGMVQWLAKYIPHLSHKMEPLNKLKRKGVVWKWEEEEKSAFNKIKYAVQNAHIVRHPNPEKEFYVICDASEYATGAVLLQEYDNIYYPIEFYSKLLDQNQRNWHISEKEIVSVVWALEKWERFLIGAHFHVFTDHKNLIQLLNYTNENKVQKSKLIRWILRLQEFEFTAHYITGAENIADYFSRDILYDMRPKKILDKNKEIKGIFMLQLGDRQVKYETITKQHHLFNLDEIIDRATKYWNNRNNINNRNNRNNINSNNNENMRDIDMKQNEEIESTSGDSTESDIEYYKEKIDIAKAHINWRDTIDMKILQEEQEQDEILGPLITALTTNNKREIRILPSYVRKQYKKNLFIVSNGILRLRNKQKQVVIPPHLRGKILEYFHSNYASLHQGTKRIYNIMKRYVYWFGMKEDIKQYIKYCDICKLAKTNASKKQGYMQLFTPERPFEMVAIDIVGPLPVTKRGNRYILTSIDRFSRFIHLIPVQNITAENIAHAFRAEYLLKYGTPKQVLSDRGSQFTGSIFNILCTLFGIDRVFTTAYHPETNGMIERMHRYLKERLRVIAMQYNLDFIKYHDWDDYLAEIEFSYNNTPHTATKRAPYEIVHGHILKTPIDRIFAQNVDKAVENTVNTMNSSSATLKLPQKVQSYVKDLKKRTNIVINEMRNNMQKYDEYRKQYYDKTRIKSTHYKNEEKVVVDVSDKVKGNKKKLNINRRIATVVDKTEEGTGP